MSLTLPGNASAPLTRLIVGACSILLCAAGCAGLETGNGQDPEPPETGEVTLTLALATADTPTRLLDSNGDALILTEATFTLSELRVELEKDQEVVDCEALVETFGTDVIDCGKSNKLDIATDILADLLTLKWTPELSLFRLPRSVVKKVRATPSAAYFAGSVSVTGGTYDVAIPLTALDVLVFESPKEQLIQTGIPLNLTLEVDVQDLLLDVDLRACIDEMVSAGSQNPLVLDDGKACSEVGAKLSKALKTATQLR